MGDLGEQENKEMGTCEKQKTNKKDPMECITSICAGPSYNNVP